MPRPRRRSLNHQQRLRRNNLELTLDPVHQNQRGITLPSGRIPPPPIQTRLELAEEDRSPLYHPETPVSLTGVPLPPSPPYAILPIRAFINTPAYSNLPGNLPYYYATLPNQSFFNTPLRRLPANIPTPTYATLPPDSLINTPLHHLPSNVPYYAPIAQYANFRGEPIHFPDYTPHNRQAQRRRRRIVQFNLPSEEKKNDTSTDEKGGGIFSSIKSTLNKVFLGPRKQAPPAVRKFIEQHKDNKIVKMEAGRIPVFKPIQQGLNALTKGKYEEKRREEGYNDIYHAFIVITLANGEKYQLEKNHVVEIKPYKPDNKENLLPVKLDKSISLGDVLSNAEKYQEKNKGKRDNFWKYDPQNNNCQYFVDDIVKGNPDIQNKEEVNKFSFQENAGKLIDTTGPYQNLLKFLPSVAATADKLYYGEGLHIANQVRSIVHFNK